MEPSESGYKEIEERFAAWARTRPDIRAAFVVGSRAREDDHPADEWADLDIIAIASNPERYLSRTDWLEEIGSVWLTALGHTVAGGPERFVLFEGGLAVDFVMIPSSRAKLIARLLPILRRFPGLFRLVPRGAMKELTLAASLFGRGFRAILDKDGLAAKLPLLLSPISHPSPPTQAEFLQVIDKFWFFADRVARKLRRGELYVAMTYHHDLMHGSLLPMTEWHAKATHGWDYETWHGAHFLEEWADPRALKGLRSAFARYEAEGVWRALLATMELFRWLAIETAERLSYPYPTVADERVTEWVQRLAENRAPSEDRA
jgi:aminoglycoside 6-adenylyltransferase